MENNKYTEKDLAAFEAKDRLHAMQTALNVAGINNTGLGKSAEDITAEANKYYAELLKAKGQIDTKAVTQKHLVQINMPVPTLEQKQIFERIAHETGLSCDFVMQKIWERKQSLVLEEKQIESCKKYLKGLKQ